MMVQVMFAVRDNKAETFAVPFCAVNDAVAVRMFAAAVNDRETPIGRNPEDFALFRIGEFVVESGMVIAAEAPKYLVNGLPLVRKEGE